MLKWAVYLRCAILAVTISLTSPLAAAIYSTGDVNPSDPSTWDSSTRANIGYNGTGSVTADGGSDLVSEYGIIGYYSGSTGEVTVDGFGSTWNSRFLFVGGGDSGTLNITNGGAVTVQGSTRVALNPGSSGKIHFDNGTLTTGCLYSSSDDLTGTGTINTHALVSDVNLVFDTTHGLNQTIYMKDNPGQNIAVNLDIDGTGSLGGGYRGVGTMSISDGVIVESTKGYLGYESGSTGVSTINGAGSAWNNSGDLNIGYEGSGTLNIADGGAVSNGTSYLGYQSGSTGVATVTGAGSTWFSYGLFVGKSGNGSLNICDSGTLTSGTGYIGERSGSIGEATVDGAGSIWNLSTLHIGSSGKGTLTISNGGVVTPHSGTLIGYKPGSTGEVNVDGTGSTLNNNYHGHMYIGYEGAGALKITNGGTVNYDEQSYIGYKTGARGEVTVDGTGSTWNTSEGLTVGNGTLNITNGGTVNNGGGIIGSYSGSFGQVTVDGAGSSWNHTGGLYIRRGIMDITNGGTVSSGYSGIDGSKSTSTNEVTVDGAGSAWNITENFRVGSTGRAKLNITNGGMVTVEKDTSLDRYNKSSGEIHFDNGTLTTRSFLGACDDLTGMGTINTNGLICDVDLVFDATHGFSQTFTMEDEKRNITVNLDVDGSGIMGAGYGGVGTMRISDGITLDSPQGYIGYESGSTGEVTVDGPGSTWNASVLEVGNFGNGTLNIINGGAVNSNPNLGWGGHYIGYASGSTGNVTVDGAGSTWTNSKDLSVGHSGSGTLNITGGGTVTVERDTRVASESGSSGRIHFDNGTLTTHNFLGARDDLTGTGIINTNGLASDVDLVFDATHGFNQTFTMEDEERNITVNLDVDGSGIMGAGYGGVGTMRISNGITLDSPQGYIGYKSGSKGEVTIDGAGSTWASSGEIFVGHEGSGTLTITDGGAMDSNNRGCYGYVGYKADSTGEVTIDGDGSIWNSRALHIGSSGNGAIKVTNCGNLCSDYSYIGYDPDSTGEVTIDGAGSRWNSDRLHIGENGKGTLNITGGGVVAGHSEQSIGYGRNSTGEVTVDGAGSIWGARELFVGYYGSGTLNITGGGAVTSSFSNVCIGGKSGSTGEVTVAGIGSRLFCEEKLGVGSQGHGTLTITDGGLVSVESSLWIDIDCDGDSFVNMSTGGMLALFGEADASGSIDEFLGLVEGADAIRYWDGLDWAHISDATMGEDYWLEYQTIGDLAGYTMLTVGVVPVPEPGAVALILIGLGTLLAVRRRR